jgi:glycine cleavage system H protein
MTAIPDNLKYTEEHEWVSIDGDVITIGITDHAQNELGDIVFVELPNVDAEIEAADAFGTIEAVKTVADLYAPVNGVVVEVNEALAEGADALNTDPYGAGWIVKMKISDVNALDSLKTADEYSKFLG